MESLAKPMLPVLAICDAWLHFWKEDARCLFVWTAYTLVWTAHTAASSLFRLVGCGCSVQGASSKERKRQCASSKERKRQCARSLQPASVRMLLTLFLGLRPTAAVLFCPPSVRPPPEPPLELSNEQCIHLLLSRQEVMLEELRSLEEDMPQHVFNASGQLLQCLGSARF